MFIHASCFVVQCINNHNQPLAMFVFLKYVNFFCTIRSRRLQTLNSLIFLSRHCHLKSKPTTNVAVFWDLDNKPPNPFIPYEAAVKLRATASSMGFIHYMVAYANNHALAYVPPHVREQRKERKMLNQLENKRLIKPSEANFCQICGRRFFNYEKLVNHFKDIHEREHKKRVNQIESAKGSRRVKLVGKYSMKMEKYKNAARDVLTPNVGYSLADELKRAGFLVHKVSNKPQAADDAIISHMVDVMDRRIAECLILVSEDSDFVNVLREAKLRCLKTVVVGNVTDGPLKRAADAAFSWKEILMGKAKKEAASVVGKWKDRDLLKRLEWKYDPKVEKDTCGLGDENEIDIEGSESDDCIKEDDGGSWWELGSETDVIKPRSYK